MKQRKSHVLDYEDMSVRIEYDYYPARRAQISGPPEWCYPEEPAEWGITGIRVMPNGYKDWIMTDRSNWNQSKLDEFAASLEELDEETK